MEGMESSEMPKVVVTGGAGFIGSAVVDGYVEAGFDVVVVDDLSSGSAANLNPAARFYKEDIRGRQAVELILDEKPTVLNHHAAHISVPRSVEDPLIDASINIMGFINLLEGCRRAGTKKVIFASSGGAIYGEAQTIPTTEQEPRRLLFPYAISKATGEDYLLYYRRQYAIDYVILRYANIYGQRQTPEGEAGVVSIFIDNLLAGRQSVIYAYDDQPEGMLRDYCHVEDVVRANMLATAYSGSGLFNIGTGVGTSTLKLYNTVIAVAERLGVELKEVVKRPLFSSPRQGELKKSCLDARKAGEELGWRPTIGLEEGIEKTLRWWLSERL